MDFSAWGTCSRVRTPECSLETLPTRQEGLISDVPSGVVAQLRGCAWMHGCAEDWGYIRPATDDESPVNVQPVTG